MLCLSFFNKEVKTKMTDYKKLLEKQNISTIATWTAIAITMLLAYFGYTVDQAQLSTVIMSIITLCIAVWSSKHPNDLAALGNNQTTIDPTEPVLNPEYETDNEEGA